MKKITKEMTFAELISSNPEAAMKLAERGLFCGGCPMAQFETIENGAMAHGVDVDALIKELNKPRKGKEIKDGKC
jgi:hybrid cluster-associated redox disulfide protein